MDSFAKGTVVLIPFPFSDLSQAKKRPAVILADGGRDDFILCQITSNPYADPRAIEIKETDFQEGSLERVSYGRPTKLFTASRELFLKTVGHLNPHTSKKIVDAVIAILNNSAQ